jgi:hypothetical protein
VQFGANGLVILVGPSGRNAAHPFTASSRRMVRWYLAASR